VENSDQSQATAEDADIYNEKLALQGFVGQALCSTFMSAVMKVERTRHGSSLYHPNGNEYQHNNRYLCIWVSLYLAYLSEIVFYIELTGTHNMKKNQPTSHRINM
jgi:hypothetical protein